MASSPARTPHVKVPRSAALWLADIVSYGYAFAFVTATLVLDLAFTVWQGVAIMALFLVLRAVANEIRHELRREAVREARRIGALRERSPSRWTPEQRDGVGRAFDLSA
jgi:hypothetical protein